MLNSYFWFQDANLWIMFCIVFTWFSGVWLPKVIKWSFVIGVSRFYLIFCQSKMCLGWPFVRYFHRGSTAPLEEFTWPSLVFTDRDINTDLKTDNLDRVSIPTKIVTTFDVEHPILGTTYGVWTRRAFVAVCLYVSNLHCFELVDSNLSRKHAEHWLFCHYLPISGAHLWSQESGVRHQKWPRFL